MNTNYIFDKILTIYSAKFYSLLILDFSRKEDVFSIVWSYFITFFEIQFKMHLILCVFSHPIFSDLAYLQNIEVNCNKTLIFHLIKDPMKHDALMQKPFLVSLRCIKAIFIRL